MKKILVLVTICISCILSIDSIFAANNPYVGGNSNCTHTAWRLVKEHTGIELPGFTGNAVGWYQGAKNYGYNVGSVPAAGSVVVYDKDYNGYGHVAYVTEVRGNQIYVQEGGYEGGYHEGWTNSFGFRSDTGTVLGYIYLKNNIYPSKPILNISVGDNINKTTLSWNTTANTNHYDIRIYKSDSTLFTSQFNLTSTSYSINLPIGSYYANVASVNSNGNYTFSSDVSFKVNVAKPSKPTLSIRIGDSKSATNFSWKNTNNTHHYDFRVYNATTNKYYSFQPNLKVTSYNLMLPAGKYYANVASVASDSNIYTFSDNVYFTIENAPTVSSDGWYYVNSLASYVTSDKYEIQYQNYYEKIQKASPGSDWKNAGFSKSVYENSGSAYWSKIELPTSNTRVLLNYKYYHYCGNDTGNRANYEVSGNYIHYDQILNINDIVVDQSGSDWENPNFKYYYLKWKNGSYAYCNSNSTCDGQYGTHGNRSFVWYKEGQYQNKIKVDYYKYTKQSGWTSKKDNSATSVKYRYKLKTTFKDVSEKAWYYNTINEVNQLGLMTGTTSTTFSPDSSMSRGMVATVLYRMAGAPNVTYKNIFNDVNKSDYYAQAVTWAYSNKIISGYSNGKFGPNDNVTREQIAVMLCNYAKYKGTKTNSNKDLSGFKDKSKISSYALPSMKWVVEKGIITGTEDKKLNPINNATRAECAKMLLQAYKLLT